MPPAFTLGLDYGTNSVRALIVNTADGTEVGSAVFNYPHGDAGIVLDSREPDLARQHPDDYLRGIIETVRGALTAAAAHPYFSADRIIGMGVDTTGSTPLPLDAVGLALALQPDYENHPAALAWLWKDHTGHAEAAEITRAAAAQHPEYLAKCGGTYSSEWFWAKLMRCARVAPDVMAAAHTWVELADWIPAVLTGTTAPAALKRCICAAGHKAMFHASWGGYPDAAFLGSLHPDLARIRATLPAESVHVGQSVGRLSAEWAALTGLPEGIPVAAGAFDAHLGGVGSGIRPGVLVKIIGTSTCDMAVAPLSMELPDIPGICGIVPESVLPGCHGLEAGQSAVGDIFNWFVKRMNAGTHEELTAGAEKLRPGESGLLSLDWHNGNRTVLVDQRLSGLTLGQTLHTTPAEMYRSLVEATAFGARAIVERFEEYGVEIRSVINCGGISLKNPMVMQIYADILNKPLEISRSSQTCALGAAMAGAVVAGKAAGGHDNFAAATATMTSVMPKRFQPIPENVAVYNELYQLYKQTHDAFGTTTTAGLGNVMKDLLRIRDRVRLG